MQLVPKLQQYVDDANIQKEILKQKNFKPNQTTLREAIAKITAKYMTFSDDDIVCIDDTVKNSTYNIPIRIYIPEATPLDVVIYFHGGGHVTGGITVYDNIVKKIAKTTNKIVASIDYRLAPEFAYPIGLDDCKCAIENIFQLLDQRKVRYKDKNLILMGDSAGGAICTSLIMDEGFTIKNSIKKQVLIYPSLDYTEESPGLNEYGEGYLLEKEKLKFYFASYFQNNEDRKAVSPLYGIFYNKMPKTLIIAAECDPLCFEAKEYYKKLELANVDAKFIEIKGVVHPFIMLEDLCKDECEQTYNEIKQFLN